MNSNNTISDVYLYDLEAKDGRLVILSEADHLLRRFGQVEYRTLNNGEQTTFTMRDVADEIWCVFFGSVKLTLIDKRHNSPSENQTVNFELDGNRPHAILIPYGVAAQFTAQKESQLLRITTHKDGTHAADKVLSTDEID